MSENFQIVPITPDKLNLVFRWYLKARGSFFIVDGQNKFLFISYPAVLKYYQNKFFIYEYLVVLDNQPVGLVRLMPEAENFSLIFDVWLESFSEEILKKLIEFIKNYWLSQKKFHKLETRVIFEKEYREVFIKAGFQTENILKDEVYFSGQYLDVETLVFIG